MSSGDFINWPSVLWKSAWWLCAALLIIAALKFFDIPEYMEEQNAITKSELAELGITKTAEDRVIKHTESGIKYFVECIEGREFIVLYTNHTHSESGLAGPINDKEC